MNRQSKQRLSSRIICLIVGALVLAVIFHLNFDKNYEKLYFTSNVNHFSIGDERKSTMTNDLLLRISSNISRDDVRGNTMTNDLLLRISSNISRGDVRGNTMTNDPFFQFLSNSSKKDELTRCMGITKRRYPTAIIAGVTKGGTTALTRFLNAHPMIAARYAKLERDMHTAFFFHGQEYIDTQTFQYKNLMPCSYSDQITMERSPAYFDSEYTAVRIRRFNPKMKIIIIVRDQIARAQSHYLMKKDMNKIQNKTFEECVTKENKTEIDEDSYIVSVSRYSQHIKSWLKNFSLKQMLILDSQYFDINPVAELHKVEDFLGIERYFTKEMFAYNDENGKYCLLTGEGNLDCMTGRGRGGRIHQSIQADVQFKLKNYFRPYNNIFFKLINRRFDWGY